jgi:hypothetical protein
MCLEDSVNLIFVVHSQALEGRMYKLFGDYSMLAGSPKDASGYYSNAIKRSSKTG